MNKLSKQILIAVLVVTIVAIVTWQATGGDWYTKYEVVEQIEATPDPNDPLASAGFYDGETTTETVRRDEFRFGLLPTPAGLFDKHVLSVASVTGPTWMLGLSLLWYRRRQTKLRRRKTKA